MLKLTITVHIWVLYYLCATLFVVFLQLYRKIWHVCMYLNLTGVYWGCSYFILPKIINFVSTFTIGCSLFTWPSQIFRSLCFYGGSHGTMKACKRILPKSSILRSHTRPHFSENWLEQWIWADFCQNRSIIIWLIITIFWFAMACL